MSEKQALADVSAPLQVETHEHDHNWDFGYSYEWARVSGLQDGRLTAEREVSYRQWSAGVPFKGFAVDLSFGFPVRGKTVRTVGVGRDGDFAVGERSSIQYRESGASSSNWFGAGPGAYMGCWKDPCHDRDPAFGPQDHTLCCIAETLPNVVADEQGKPIGQTFKEACASHCSGTGYSYMGLQFNYQCTCANDYGYRGPENPQLCGAEGELCGAGHYVYGCINAVFSLAAWTLDDDATGVDAGTFTCWSSLASLVPDSHTISEQSTDRSSQGEAYFTDRFCPGWSSYIVPACDPDTQACNAASPGNAIFDGGNDMYDIGNLIVTNLMGDCSNDPHDCALGSLMYRGDFERVPTNCFGAGGHYQMQQSDEMMRCGFSSPRTFTTT